jgi:hypothetical protein
MYSKDVLCGKSRCGKPATHKIASPWSYGRFQELKCYGLACSEHFADTFRGCPAPLQTSSPLAG